MPDSITPVGAMIKPMPSGMGMLSDVLGVQQQQQNLQTGQFTQQKAQAEATQAQLKTSQIQALSTFAKNAAANPDYWNPDGSANVGKFQRDALGVAPLASEYVGNMTTNFNGAVENRKALLALTNQDRATVGNIFNSVISMDHPTQKDFLEAAEQARGVSDDPLYQHTVSRMLMNAPQTAGMTTEQAENAIREAARRVVVGTNSLNTSAQPTAITTGAGVVNRAAVGGGLSAPPGAPPGSPLNPTPPQVAGATTRQTGTGSADIDTSNVVVAAQKNARANIDLTKRIDQLADVVSPGRLPAEVSSGLGALGLQNVNQARTELIKDLGRLQTNYTERAGSDERARTILSGLPTDTTPTQTIHQAMDVTRGSARQDLSLGALREKNAKATNGQMNGFQGDYAHAVSAASPLMHEYFALSPQEQVGFFKRNFQTKQQAQAFRAQAESVKKMSPDAVSQ